MDEELETSSKRFLLLFCALFRLRGWWWKRGFAGVIVEIGGADGVVAVIGAEDRRL